MTDYVAKANSYIEKVLKKEILACKWVKLACKRQKNDLKRAKTDKNFKYHFNEDAANRICAFIEKMPHVKGREWKSKYIILEDWQCFQYTTVFGWVHKDNPNRRRFKVAYTEVPRKNAKTTGCAPVGLYLLRHDGEPGADIYSAATTRDQARIVFSIASRMANKRADWRDECGVEVLKTAIVHEESGSSFSPLSADDKTLDGLNVYGAIIDELHAHKTRAVFDVIETAMGSRTQALMWIITTAGVDQAGICYEQRNYVTKILEGVIQDDTYFGIIYTIDDKDDWTKPESWIKANPNWGVSVRPEEIERLAKKAMQLPSAVNNFLTKHLNVWVQSDRAWMNMLRWEKQKDETLNLDDFAGEICYIGIDLASKRDIAAMMLLFERLVEGTYHYYPFGFYFLPEDTIAESLNSQYEGWARAGHFQVTPGNIIDFEQIEEMLSSFEGRFNIREVLYDPFQATQFATRMLDRGFPMIELGATVKNFSEPMKELEALVYSGQIHHPGNPVLTWAVSNVVCHTDFKDNIFPRKELPQNKIDPVVALIMCMNRAIVNREPASPYETRGILTL